MRERAHSGGSFFAGPRRSDGVSATQHLVRPTSVRSPMPSEQAGEHGMIGGTDGVWVPRPVDHAPRADSPSLRPVVTDRESATSPARRIFADDRGESAGADAEQAS